MRDLFLFGAGVLLALLFATSQLADRYGARGDKFTQAALIPFTHGLSLETVAPGAGTSSQVPDTLSSAPTIQAGG